MNDFAKRLEEIVLDKERGAAQLAGVAIRALLEFCRSLKVVLVGADAICSDLAVVNKVGTKMVCLLAKKYNVTSVVAADTYKILPDVASEQVILEEKDGAEVWQEYPF